MARSPSPDDSPEVEFGAFRRSQSRTGNYSTATSSSSTSGRPLNGYAGYTPSAPTPRPVIATNAQQQRATNASAGKMRQSAPRLGGLGLGGIQSSASQSRPAVGSTAGTSQQAPRLSPTRPLNIQRKSSSGRKPAPAPTIADMKAVAPASSSNLAASTSPKVEGQTERPFLSPEMQKPTMRTGAFALERPVPEVLASSTPTNQLPSPPESPAEEATPEFFGHSPPTTPGQEDIGSAIGKVVARAPLQDAYEAETRQHTLPRAESAPKEHPAERPDSDTMEVLERSSKASGDDAQSMLSDTSFASAQDDTGGEEINFGSPPLAPVKDEQAAVEAHSPGSAYDSESEAPLQVLTDSGESVTSDAWPQTPPQQQTSSQFASLKQERPPSASIEELLSSRAGYAQSHEGGVGYIDADRDSISSASVRDSPFLSTDPVEAGMLPGLAASASAGMARSSSSRSVRSGSRSPAPPRPSRAKRPPGSSSGHSNPASPTLSAGEFSASEDDTWQRGHPRLGLRESESNGEWSHLAPHQPLADLESTVPANESRDEHVSNVEPRSATPPPAQREELKTNDNTPTISRHASYTASPPTTPTANNTTTYEGLGLRLPSSLRGRRNSRSISATSGPLSPSLAQATTKPVLPPIATSVASPQRIEGEQNAGPASPISTASVPSCVAHVPNLRRASLDRDASSPVERQAATVASPGKIDESVDEPAPASVGASVNGRADSAGVVSPVSSADDSAESSPAEAESAAASPVSVSEPVAQLATDPASSTASASASRRGSDASNGGGVTDIGAAAVGAIVTGGMAVGWAAWRSLSAAASYGLGRSSSTGAAADGKEETLASTAGQDIDTPDMRDLPGKFDRGAESDKDSDGGDDFHDAADDDEAEPKGKDVQPIETEYGEIEFPAPEGFLEAFKQAMDELGPEDIAANEQTEAEAAAAAYEAALQLHRETASPPQGSIDLPFPGKKPIKKRDGITPMRSQSPRQEFEDDYDTGEERDEQYEELMDLVSPMFAGKKSGKDQAYQYSPPPGLSGGEYRGAGMARTFSQQSTASSASSKATARSPNPALKASLAVPKSRSLFGFGGGSNHERRGSVDSDQSPPPSYRSQRATSIASVGSNDEADPSIASGGTAGKLQRNRKTRSIFGRKSSTASSSSMPSIESQISDMTYVSYSSGRAAKRKSSLSSSSTGDPSSPLSSTSPVPLDAAASHNLPRQRRSSLRKVSRYDPDNKDASSEPSKVYRVRFGNASRGIGLRSVAEDEAERAGGEEYAIRWVGVGRGNRYGNLLIQTDEDTDEKYAIQVNDIKRSWRVKKGKNYNRDWTTVRID